MATDQQVDDAIKRVLESPTTASAEDYRLTRQAAGQAGQRGNRATEALRGEDTTQRNFLGF